MFIRDIGLKFSSFVVSFPCFRIKVMFASLNGLGSILSSSTFWKNFEEDGY